MCPPFNLKRKKAQIKRTSLVLGEDFWISIRNVLLVELHYHRMLFSVINVEIM
jgi:hypothetical protein